MLNKNDQIHLEITAVAHDGNGLGRHDGQVVFVPLTVDGDIAQVRVGKVQKTTAYGILQNVQTPSPHRMADDCAAYRSCGGCGLRHMSYEHELALKAGWVAENLERIGGISLEPESIVPSPKIKGYRNKAQIPVAVIDGKLRAGFYARRSHRVVPWDTCDLQPPVFSDITRFLLDYMEANHLTAYDEATGSGLVRHIYLRIGEATGQIMVCLVVNGQSLPGEDKLARSLSEAFPEVETVTINSNTRDTNVILGPKTRVLMGEGVIRDTIAGVEVELSAQSFYQVNRGAAENLYAIAKEYAGLTGTEILLDLYCGVGTIGLSMADRVKSIVGVELVEKAVEDARRNAKLGGFGNASFFCGDAKEAAGYLERQGIRPDVVVVDPPRKGCDEGVLDSIGQMAPSRVVYISCNSATLARDCRRLEAMGYKAVRARPVDMFPRTAHVESVVLLSRV